MSEQPKPIPKFGTFRSKPIPNPPPAAEQVEEKDSSKSRGGTQDREESSAHHRHHRTHSRERRPRHRSKTRQTSSKYDRPVEAKPSPPPLKQEPADLFVVDRKGDVKNLVYGSIHRYSVPPFHRAGAGGVLGASPDVKIDRDHGDDKGIVLRDRRGFKPNSREKYVFSNIEKLRPRLLKIRPGMTHGGPEVGEADYVPLHISGSKKRKREDAEDNSDSDEEGTNYRSIHGKANAKDEPADDNFQYATESESSGSETGRAIKLDASVRQKNVELSRKVEQSPHDTAAWLALIEHQDSLIRSEGDQRRITNAEMKSTADIKIHIFEKALEKARSLEDRETLLLGLMTEGAKIWEIKAQSDRWEQISKDNIDSLVLWNSYLNFKQTTFGTFQYEEVRDIFLRRIKLLAEAAMADTTYSLYRQLVYVLLRFTTFVRESGYAELAVAIWQGVLEFNLFAPSLPTPPGEQITLFKEFWDSEVPRIGEDTAHGWRHFLGNEGTSEAPEALVDEDQDLLDNKNLLKSWAAAEQTRSRVSRLPARTMDEVVEDDPFRVILASDIEDFLIRLPSESVDLRKSLLDAFLVFCRMPPLVSFDEILRRWSSDPFIGTTLLDCDASWTGRYFSQENREHEGAKEVDISTILETPSLTFQSSPESMFGSSWFKSIWAWREVYCGDNGPVKYDWFRNALKQLLQASFREDLAEYYLAFEWRNEPESIKKVSKNLLKQHPWSLRLYNAYAIIEWSRGNKEIAKGVFSAALNMGKSMPDGERDVSIILWKSWAWACLEDSDNSTALHQLLSVESGTQNNDSSAAPFEILKTKQHLLSRRDYHLFSGELRIAIIYAECLALVEYLTSKAGSETQSNTQGNITAGLLVYTNFSKTLTQILKDRNLSDTNPHELFLQSAARLLYHHARIGPFRPALLREHLTKFLTLFPQNTIFLSLYSFNESRLRIDNRVRNILSSIITEPSNDTITSRIFAIHYEMHHGTIHSVRSAFERALSAPSAKSSPGLWRFYILYCLQTPKFRPQVKEIWYRALRDCPWAKELFILGFQELGDSVEFAELKGTWRVMVEKGLRVHVDLEDKFEEIGALEGPKEVKKNSKRIVWAGLK